MNSWLRLTKLGLPAWACCLIIGVAFLLNGCGGGSNQSPSLTASGSLLGYVGVSNGLGEGSGGSVLNILTRVDPNTGLASSLVTFPGYYTGSTIDAADNLLYVCTNIGLINPAYQLMVIDLQASKIIRTVNTLYSGVLIYDPGKQRLLGTTGGFTTGANLVAIDPNTGNVANLVTFPSDYFSPGYDPKIDSIAIDPADHLLYLSLSGLSGGPNFHPLVIADLRTDSIIRAVNAATNGYEELLYDTGTTKLYNFENGRLAIIDPNTGAASIVASVPGITTQPAIDPTNHLFYVFDTSSSSHKNLAVFDLKTGHPIRTINFQYTGFIGVANK